MKWPWLKKQQPAPRTAGPHLNTLEVEVAPPSAPAIVQMGIIRRAGISYLAHPDARVRGVKLVSVSESTISRYNKALAAWQDVQDELQMLPTSLRPRRRTTKQAATNGGSAE